MFQPGVDALVARLGQHVGRDVDADEAVARQIGQHDAGQAGAAAEVEDIAEAVRAAATQNRLGGLADQAGDPVAKADEMLFKTFGVAVEHGFEIFGRRLFAVRQQSGGADEVANIRVFRGEAEGVLIGFRGFLVAVRLAERVAEQAEGAGIGDAVAACGLAMDDDVGEIASAHRGHHRGDAQAGVVGRAGDRGAEHFGGGCVVAGAAVRLGEAAPGGGEARRVTGGLAEAGDGVGEFADLDHHQAEHRLGPGVAGGEDHRVGRIGHGARHVIGVGANLGAQHVKRATAGVLCDSAIEHRRGLRELALGDGDTGVDLVDFKCNRGFKVTRGGPSHGGEHRLGGAEAAGLHEAVGLMEQSRAARGVRGRCHIQAPFEPRVGRERWVGGGLGPGGEAGREVLVDGEEEIDVRHRTLDLPLDGAPDRDQGCLQPVRQGVVGVTHEVDHGAPQASGIGQRTDHRHGAGTAGLAQGGVGPEEQVRLLFAQAAQVLRCRIGARHLD